MSWLPALIGAIIGATIASGTQLFLFINTARKERIHKVRDALAEFGAAAFGYLDAQENLAAFVQRQMNMPRPSEQPPIDVQPPEELAKEYARQDAILDARERAAGTAYWDQRAKLLASKAKLIVLTSDRGIQLRTTEMWQRLIDMKPSAEGPLPGDGLSNPEFALVKLLRSEVDQWLTETSEQVSKLFQ